MEQARAAKLPSFTLTGSLGVSSSQLDRVINPEDLLWNAVGGMLFPIFNAGELDAEVDIKTAEQKAAIAGYQQSALDAFAEVETSLSNETLYRLRQFHL